jgi:hypothetical protein
MARRNGKNRTAAAAIASVSVASTNSARCCPSSRWKRAMKFPECFVTQQA